MTSDWGGHPHSWNERGQQRGWAGNDDDDNHDGQREEEVDNKPGGQRRRRPPPWQHRVDFKALFNHNYL
jgi:hypothetical protein